jgi:hypothetical protein
VSARTEAELARKEELVGRSLAGLPVSGADTGVDLPRPRTGLMSSEDSWPRPRGGQPSRLLELDSWRRSWRRWPGRDDDVVLQSGDPRTASPSEARSDLAEGVGDAEGAAAVGVLGPTAHLGLPLKVFSRSKTVSTTVAEWFVPIARGTVDKIYRFGPLRNA